MRLNKALLGIVGLIAIGGTSACGSVSAAHAATNAARIEGATVEVSPNVVGPGSRVAVRASCTDKSTSATVTSPAFGTITVVQVNPSSPLLSADATVANTVQPSTFPVTVTCLGGATATTKLIVAMSATATAQPTVGPNTGGGFLGGREDGVNPALPWLAGSAATLVLAATLGAASVRRRRMQARTADDSAGDRGAADATLR